MDSRDPFTLLKKLMELKDDDDFKSSFDSWIKDIKSREPAYIRDFWPGIFRHIAEQKYRYANSRAVAVENYLAQMMESPEVLKESLLATKEEIWRLTRDYPENNFYRDQFLLINSRLLKHFPTKELSKYDRTNIENEARRGHLAPLILLREQLLFEKKKEQADAIGLLINIRLKDAAVNQNLQSLQVLPSNELIGLEAHRLFQETLMATVPSVLRSEIFIPCINRMFQKIEEGKLSADVRPSHVIVALIEKMHKDYKPELQKMLAIFLKGEEVLYPEKNFPKDKTGRCQRLANELVDGYKKEMRALQAKELADRYEKSAAALVARSKEGKPVTQNIMRKLEIDDKDKIAFLEKIIKEGDKLFEPNAKYSAIQRHLKDDNLTVVNQALAILEEHKPKDHEEIKKLFEQRIKDLSSSPSPARPS